MSFLFGGFFYKREKYFLIFVCTFYVLFYVLFWRPEYERANQRGSRIAPSPFFLANHKLGIFSHRTLAFNHTQAFNIQSRCQPVIGQIELRISALVKPPERTQTLTRRPYLPVSRARIYALKSNCDTFRISGRPFFLTWNACIIRVIRCFKTKA